MEKLLEELRAKLQKSTGALEELVETFVDDEGNPRDFTEDEQKAIDAHSKEIEEIQSKIETTEKAVKALALKATPADGEKGRVVAAEPKDDKRFPTFGLFLKEVIAAGANGNKNYDPRLQWQKASGSNEAVPSEGGFLVQTDFSEDLMGLMHEMGHVVSRVRKIPLSDNSNGIKLPAVNESSRATGSRFGGLQAYWANEAATVTASKPDFRLIELGLNKLMAIGYATDELLADTTAMGAIYRQGFAEEISFTLENAIYSGTGSGQPVGFMTGGALITVAKESGQAAATIVAANILKMMARMTPRSVSNSVWMINQDCLPQLWQLTIGSGTATHLMFAPPGLTGDNSSAPHGTLMGRPIIPVEYASTVGTTGDIVLVDLSQYLMIDKGGVKSAESMHVRFLYEEQTFRISYRVDGQPAWNSPVTPFKGTNTISPFIALATRA